MFVPRVLLYFLCLACEKPIVGPDILCSSCKELYWQSASPAENTIKIKQLLARKSHQAQLTQIAEIASPIAHISNAPLACENLRIRQARQTQLACETPAIHWALPYGGVGKALIEAVKLKRLRAPCYEFALLLHKLLPEGICIAPVPASPSGIKKRGFDHMLLVAKHLERLGHHTHHAFVRKAPSLFAAQQKEQKARKASERDSSDMLLRTTPIRKKTKCPQAQAQCNTKEIWIIDDICTTGTSLLRCYELLKAEGFEVKRAVAMLVF